MLKINAIQTYQRGLYVEVEVTLSMGLKLAIEVNLKINPVDRKNWILQPTHFGGCITYDPDKPLCLDNCVEFDCMGNHRDLLKLLDRRNLISLNAYPDEQNWASWNLTKALKIHFQVESFFIPTKRTLQGLICKLIESTIPVDLFI
jgi:hypothetical protein